MEENTEKKEQSTVEEMIATFRKGWDTVVNLIHQLTGLEGGAARNALLVAIAPLLTAAATFINWVYLYVHYHVIYNVPANDLTVSTALLVRFAAIVIAIGIVICVSYLMLKFIRKHMKFLGRPLIIIIISVILIIIIASATFIQYRYKINYDGEIITAQFSKNISTDEIDIVVNLIKVGTFFIKGMANLSQSISHLATLVAAILLTSLFSVIRTMLMEENGLFNEEANTHSNKKRQPFTAVKEKWPRVALVIFTVTVLILFFVVDDMIARASPYAITSDQKQVIVYREKNYCVLEPAKIEVNETTKKVTLTIDTSQQQIVDSTSLSYEYQSFDTVEIIKAKSDNQDSADDSSISDNEESSAVADVDIDPADTSTDPADGAASYDTSN
ncbi:MAG: hypothetical protein LIO95_05200 [Clostridiales bacterium]|nr:hypothetical protein [Clostridiales bacterium]